MCFKVCCIVCYLVYFVYWGVGLFFVLDRLIVVVGLVVVGYIGVGDYRRWCCGVLGFVYW